MGSMARSTPRKNTPKLGDRFPSRCSWPAIALAPATLPKPGTSFLITCDGLPMESGFRNRALAASRANFGSSKATAMACGSPRYQASNSRHAMRTTVSGLPACSHRAKRRCLTASHREASWSRKTTNRVSGLRHARSFLGTLRSRSAFPSCVMSRNRRSGKRRGRRPFRNSRMERSSKRKTTSVTAVRIPGTVPASRERRGDLLLQPDSGSARPWMRAGRC